MPSETAHGVCEACWTVVDPWGDRCDWCGRAAPESGWVTVDGDPWLGREIHGFHVRQRLDAHEALYRVQRTNGECCEMQFFRLNRLTTQTNWTRRAERVREIASPRYFIEIRKAWELDEYGILLYAPTRGMRLTSWREREEDISPAAALEFARQLLCGVMPLHRNGMHHGAINPEGLMVTLEREEVVRIMTVGRSIGLPAQTNETGYGPDTPVGAAADDVHAIGAVLFWLMTGTRPSGGVLGADPRRLLREHPAVLKLVQTLTQDGRPATAAAALSLLEKHLAATPPIPNRAAYPTPTPVDTGDAPSDGIRDPISGEVFPFDSLFEL